MKAVKTVGTIIKILLGCVVGVLLVYNVYALVARLAFGNGMPTFFGFGSAVVETGSMEPEISAGDLIIVHAEDGYSVGDVVTFLDGASGSYITHRIVFASDGHYATQGDANNVQDDIDVTDSTIVGKVVAVIRGAGGFVKFVQSPLGMFVFIAGGAIIWLLTDLLSGKIKKREKETDGEKGA